MQSNAFPALLVLSPVGLILAGCDLVGGPEPERYADHFGITGDRAVYGTSPEAGFANFIVTLAGYDQKAGTLAYMTGGSSSRPDHGVPPERQSLPHVVRAEHGAGNVAVRVRAADNSANMEPLARWVADSIHLATTEVWPGSAVPVEVDVHILDEDRDFALGRVVEWQEGDAYRLAIFIADTRMERSKSVSAHELYHLLAIRWSIGTEGPEGQSRPEVAKAYEEVAANLYDNCAQLLTDGYLERPHPANMGVLNGRELEYPLSQGDLRILLYALKNPDSSTSGMPVGAGIGKLLEIAPINAVFGDHEQITLEDPRGQELIRQCREFSEDPMRLEAWFSQRIE